MASLSKKFSMWRLRGEESQRDNERSGSRDSHESDDSSYYSKLSGPESQTTESSSTMLISGHESPQSPPRTLRQKASNLFSDLSTSVRSKAPLLHSISLSSDHYEHLLFQKPEPETPKALRRRPSLMSSIKSRGNPFSPRIRDLENGIPESPKTPVPTSDEEPPKLDVIIPSSSLNEKPSRPATIGVFRMMACTNLPPPLVEFCPSPRIIPADQLPDKDFPSGLHALPPALEDPYVDKDGSYCRSDHFITSALALTPPSEPKNRSLGENKGCLVMAETNAETIGSNCSSLTRLKYSAPDSAETEYMSPCPYCHRSGCRVSTLSFVKSPWSRLRSSQRPCLRRTRSLEGGVKELLLTTSLGDGLKDWLPTTSLKDRAKNSLPSSPDVIESKRTSLPQFLSSDTDEADTYSSDASSELPSKRFRAAWEKRKSERHSRYLEAIDGAETDSDTSIHSSLKLRRHATRSPIVQLRTRRHKAEAGTAVSPKRKVRRRSKHPFRTSNNSKDSTKPANTTAAESEFSYKDGRPSPMLEIGSELVDTGTTSVDIESPVAKSASMSRDRSLTHVTNSEQHSSLPLNHTRNSERGFILNGNSHDLPREPTPPLAESPAYVLPTSPKYTMMSMNITLEDMSAFQARNSAKGSSGSESINANVNSVSKREAFQDGFVSNAPEQKVYQRLIGVYNRKVASGLLDLDPPNWVTCPDTPTKHPETASVRKAISESNSPVSDSTDQSCALTTHSPSCSAPIPFLSLHVRSEHAHPDPKIDHLLDSHDGPEIPPNNSDVQPSSPDSINRTYENEKVLDTQKNATATTTAAEPNPCDFTEREVRQDFYAGEDVCTRLRVNLDPEEKTPHNRLPVSVTTQETACLTASPLSLGSPLSPLSSEPPLSRHHPRKEKSAACCEGSPCSRSGSATIKEKSLKSTSELKFEFRRSESHEVKPTAYTGYELDNELTLSFKQGSPISTKSNSPIRSPRDRGTKAVYFSKDVQTISHDGASDRCSRSPSPKRPTKWMSIEETQHLLQKELENKDGKIEDSYNNNPKIEAPNVNALVEGESSRVDKPRWRVPGSTISKVPDDDEQ